MPLLCLLCMQPSSWLSEFVGLPGGYRTTRRDLLKLGSLSLALGALYVTVTRAQVRLPLCSLVA